MEPLHEGGTLGTRHLGQQFDDDLCSTAAILHLVNHLQAKKMLGHQVPFGGGGRER